MSHFVPSFTLLVAFVTTAVPSLEERTEPLTELQNTGFESDALHEGAEVFEFHVVVLGSGNSKMRLIRTKDPPIRSPLLPG